MSTRRYARHVMLPEVGVDGQARLEATEVALGDTALEDTALADTALATEVARLYLERAGVRVADGARLVEPVDVPAGRDELRAAAGFLSGAWTALEVMKAAIGVGRPAAAAPPLTGPDER